MQPRSGLDANNQKSKLQVIAITAGKGGVGKTNISVNISASLAKYGKKVMLLDADLGLGNVDVLLGLHPKKNISHVLDGSCSLEQIMLKGPNDISIIPAASGVQKMCNLTEHQHHGLVNAFDDLANKTDVLVVDTAAGISNSVLNFVRATQEAIVVVCDEPTSITDAYATIKVLNKFHGVSKFKIIANMVNSPREGELLFKKLFNVASAYLEVNLELLGIISYDNFLKRSVKQQKAVIDAYPQSRVAKEFYKIAENIMLLPNNYSSSGNLSFFIERLVEA